MGNRHKARGGKMSSRDDYSGTGEPNVVKEAKSDKNMKRGGHVVDRDHDGMKAGGKAGKHRIKKARGGGCDQNPFSSAHRG